MVALAAIGLFFIILSGIVNGYQLKKFFKALSVLNGCTETVGDKVMYVPRLICLMPLLAPMIPDVLLMAMGGAVGLGGGVLGFIIGIGGTCCVTLIIKFFMNISKVKVGSNDYKYERQLLKEDWKAAQQ